MWIYVNIKSLTNSLQDIIISVHFIGPSPSLYDVDALDKNKACFNAGI